jgi:hypothetical protein
MSIAGGGAAISGGTAEIAGGTAAIAAEATIVMGMPEDLIMSAILAADSVTHSAKTSKRLGIDVAGCAADGLLG